MSVFAALALAACAGPQQPEDPGVGREVALRGLAYELTRAAAASFGQPAGSLPFEFVRDAVLRVLPAQESWTQRFAGLDAASRAGLLLAGAGAQPGADERPEIFSAQVRVAAVGTVPDEFMGLLADALRSPYRAVRTAALDRLARALIADEPIDAAWGSIVAVGEQLGTETPGELVQVIARSGARSQARAKAALELLTQVDASSVGEGVSDIFGAWITHPLDARAVRFLRDTCVGADPAQRALVEALALVATERDGAALTVPPDIALVAALFTGRDAPPAGGDDLDLDERAELVARQAGSLALGRALMGLALGSELEVAGRMRCVRGAAWSLPLEELLVAARGLGIDGTLEVWDVVSDRRDALPPVATAHWIVDAAPGVRAAAARVVGRRYAEGEDPALAALLAQMLRDEGATQRSLAFSWLCDGPHAARFGPALRTAFDAESEPGRALAPRQVRWLARLPRRASVPAFRDVILGLVQEPATRTPPIIELLGTLSAGDAGLAAVLDQALSEELAALEQAAEFRDRLAPDGRAAALVRALHRTGGAAAVPDIWDALLRSMGPLHGVPSMGAPSDADGRPQLPKTAVALLARTPRGRAELPRLLAIDGVVPRRVRFEVALQLAATAAGQPGLAQRVGALIVADFDHVDGTLRMRGIAALAALAPSTNALVDDALGALAQGQGGDHAERLAAIAALGERGASTILLGVARWPLTLDQAGLADLEAAGGAVRGLGGPAMDARGTEVARALLDLVRTVDLRVDESGVRELEVEALTGIRGALLTSICAGIARREGSAAGSDRLDPSERREIQAALVRGPLRAGPGDIADRFAGLDLGDVRFRWRSELDAIEVYAPAAAYLVPPEGTIGAAVDSRLLLVAGDATVRAGLTGRTPEWLLATGLFGTLGERRTADAERDLFLGRAALVEVHLAHKEWDAAALQTILMLVDVRRARVRRTVLEILVDLSDPSVPRDADARLAGLVRVFRGRAALARGAGPGDATRWADAARPWAALDTAVAHALAELEAEIANGRR